MHCKDWEERIALHVGGDLPAAERSAVERHLAECGGCQVLWSGMKESLELLHGAHAEPLPPAAYTAVRGRVMAELAAGRRVWWRWAGGLAAAAAIVIMVALAVWPEPRVAPLPRIALAIPPAPELHLTLAPHAFRAAPLSRAARVSKRSPQPLLVRLITDDPNIVIYWIAD
ncbi:MAG TPA: zf-HC2 domain-containing protein [Candidatus Acidoferrales bacterium]|nr:zf-HC2 domain-containing protein [Candidatus Acidoferrales bacterium]